MSHGFAEPFPFEDGVFVIHRSDLTDQLREVLNRVELADARAARHRTQAEEYTRAGEEEFLIESRRKLSTSCARTRDLLLRYLWLLQGAKPPRELTFRMVKIEN